MIDERNSQASTQTAMEELPLKTCQNTFGGLKLILNGAFPYNILPGQPYSEIRKDSKLMKKQDILNRLKQKKDPTFHYNYYYFQYI